MPNPGRTITFAFGMRASRTVLVCVTVLSCAYVFVCMRTFRAEQFAHSGSLDDLTRATQLEPDNAMNWHRLGLARLYQQNDPEGSLAAFQRALRINPHNADSWIGTAYAFQFLEKPDEERLAVERALQAEPKRLEISWQAASLYAVLGDRELMIKQICELIHHDRRRSEDARELARKITGSSTVDCSRSENQP